ncbi:hypothetical protein K1719_023838 [Acacia pycnantha]|nr:hypothetical protein K1719_023838 [Acacia pycnantha]
MRPLRRTLVVKLLGRQLSYDFMVKKLRQIWARKDAYLSVLRWKPEFTPKSEKIDSVVAWVRARGKFARMCVELDLTKPLVPEFSVEGRTLSGVYESLGMEVENNDETKKGESSQNVAKELWKTVQRTRRPRGNVIPVHKQSLGLRFSVLNEVNEDGDRHIGGSEGTMAEGVPVSGHSKGAKKGFEKCGGGGQSILTEHNKGISVRVDNDSQLVYRSYEVVPETNLEKYGGRKVDMIGKENLHPSEYIGGVGAIEVRGQVGMDQPSEEEDPIESSGMVMEEECVALTHSD